MNDGSKLKPVRTQDVPKWPVAILFEESNDKDYGLMKKENLLKIEKVENYIKNHKYWTQLCKAKSVDDPKCSDSSFLSPLMFLRMAGMTSSIESYTQTQINFYYNKGVKSAPLWKNF